MTRSISHSEAAVLLDCQAKHDFAYGDQMAGSSLKPRTKHVRLREGKAWGRAMAVYHEKFGSLAAHYAIDTSLREDTAEAMIEPEEFEETRTKLHAILDQYTALCEPLEMTRAEFQLDANIPSRGGKRASNRYKFTGFVDGIQTDPYGKDWLVEFKLRGSLSSVEQVASMRQIRWYAWAYQQQTGRPVAGVIVDERLNQAPQPVRILESGLPSHAVNQVTTPGLYVAACREHGVEPSADTLVALGDRRWQERHFIFLTEAEIHEAGLQLTSVANITGQFDSQLLYPTRNPSQFRCPNCAFKDICNTPSDAELVDALFDRVPAKKDRQEVAAA